MEFSLRLTIFTREKKNRKSRKTCLQYRRKRKYVIHIRALKQALNHGLILKEVHRVIQFNQLRSMVKAVY